MTATMAMAQGLYFTLTAVWPLVHLRSFLLVTGPKTDLWLVRTVGALLAVIGITLLLLARVPEGHPSGVRTATAALGAGSAAALLLIDIIYVTRRVIRPIYLADAVAEFLLIVGWCMALAVDHE
ncbi:MAG TPA: hypothetical protein VF720_09840 [Candidatus Eisenbacteria bacterium]